MDQAMKLKRNILLGVVLASLAIASCILWIALDHNPQGEFYGSELGVNWRGIALLWVGTFAIVLIILGGLAWGLLGLGLAIVRRAGNRD